MKKPFPQYLSSPFQVLWFESDELGIICVFFTVAMIFGSFTWLLLIAGPWYYTHLKKKYPRGFLRHFLYFLGLTRLDKYPGYFEDVFYE
jgi:type IV conjugative transfer system protein TraL